MAINKMGHNVGNLFLCMCLSGIGLRPGLLQKWQAAVTAESKFAFLKAFLLDPTSLASITIESEYVDMAMQENDSKWVEAPLNVLKKEFVSPEERKFLMEKVVGVQAGRPHPQDPENEEMKLYWIFRESSESSRHRKSVGHRTKAEGTIPNNAAAVQAVSDGLVGFGAGFGKGNPAGNAGGGENHQQKGKGGKAKGGKGKGGKSKGKKVGIPRFQMLFCYGNHCAILPTQFCKLGTDLHSTVLIVLLVVPGRPGENTGGKGTG